MAVVVQDYWGSYPHLGWHCSIVLHW